MSRVKKQILGKLKEYANKMGRDHLGGDDIPGNKKKGGLRDNDGYDNVQYNRDMPQDEARDPNLYYVLYRKIGKSGNPASAGYESKKDAEKFAKSLSKTHTTMVLPKQMVEGMELANEQGVGTATVFLKNQEELDEGGLPQNWMAGRTSDYHTKLRGKKRNYDDTNFAKMNTGQPDIEDEELDPDNEVVNEKFNKVEHLSLLNKALKAMPGSQNQKEIIRQLNVVRKAGGMRPLKEQSIVEYASRLTNAYILDDESVLDGTPEPKDAINKESAKKKSEKNYKDWKNTNETVDKDDLKNAKFRLKKVLKYLDIEYKKTRRGEKYVQINYIPVTRPQSQNPEFVNVRYEDEKDLQNIGKALKLKLKESVSEVAERDYKDEYKKFQSSTKSKKYRAELNKYNRDKGTYGNGDGKDASHKGGKIVGFESEKKNRGRAEKSRLKKK